ncbi:hypothetical protein DDZ14_05905 [Maritimibacter sp. 55A14]|uniref:class I SAM-dependent methyltransferase n=1 Tax=Maritimibacter sp. 55A14 TaxID=2174844 RepID=UPI000D60965D|nr:class I SAM-dependent methyltransferase [Maritimibacter sp. 55A14]PWE33313.1 hypothetical protein DDZ14_05905 [Maritimibacter sp. 55A14]
MRLGRPKPGHEQHPDFPKIDGMRYTEVLGAIEARRGIDWYLEIGSRSGTSIAQRKCNFVAVDPFFAIKAPVFNGAPQMHFMQMTSDDFFASGFLQKAGIRPDLAFIDGLHLFEFALRDFMNAEKTMGRDGIICLHDVCPFNYAMTTRDTAYYEKLRRPWTGDVWKVMAVLMEYRPDLKIDILPAHKTGLGCVTHLEAGNTVLDEKYDEILARYQDFELEDAGAGSYYGSFSLRDPEAYLHEL